MRLEKLFYNINSVLSYLNLNIITCYKRIAPFHFFTVYPTIFIIENLDSSITRKVYERPKVSPIANSVANIEQ